MKKNMLALIFIVSTMITLTGCTSNSSVPSASSYHTITSDEAKKMMEENPDIIILDVRTEEEYKEGYINKALLLPYDEITTKAEATLDDKAATVLVYCRTGRRSALAAQSLVDLGYTNIYDFGGITDWDYDTVQE